MKKFLSVAIIAVLLMTACNDSNTTETTTTGSDSAATTGEQGRAKEISDSTKMLDKKLADPNSTYSPDSLK